MTRLKLDQFVEKEICDKYVVELSLGDLQSCSWRRKPWPINDNLHCQSRREDYSSYIRPNKLNSSFALPAPNFCFCFAISVGKGRQRCEHDLLSVHNIIMIFITNKET